MPILYSYQKVTDEYTTYELMQPDYEQMAPDAARMTELCTIANKTYVMVPDGVILPDQPKRISTSIKPVALTSSIKAKINKTSPHLILITKRITKNEDIKYTKQDKANLETLMALLPSAMAFNTYMTKSRSWDKEAISPKI